MPSLTDCYLGKEIKRGYQSKVLRLPTISRRKQKLPVRFQKPKPSETQDCSGVVFSTIPNNRESVPRILLKSVNPISRQYFLSQRPKGSFRHPKDTVCSNARGC